MLKRLFFCVLHFFIMCSLLFAGEHAVNSVENNAMVFKVTKGIPNPDGHVQDLYLLSGNLKKGTVSFDQSLVQLPQKSFNKGEDKILRLFHFNDMHGNIVKYNKKGDTHNFAQFVKRVKDTYSKLGKNEAVLFISAGDDHIGTSFDELLGNKPEEFIKSVPYHVYSKGGVDFSIVGNHEFDKHTAIFNKSARQDAKFTILSSNIVNSQFNTEYFPAAIAVVNGLRIGLIGLSNDKETPIRTTTDKTVETLDPLDALKAIVPELSKHSDVIIVLSHLGYDVDQGRYTLETGDSAIAKTLNTLTMLPSIVVGGHTHSILNTNELESKNVFGKVPVVQAGQYGENLGEVTLKMNNTDKGFDYLFEAKLHPTLPGFSKNENAKIETTSDYDLSFQNNVIDPIKKIIDEKMLEVIAKTENNKDLSDEITVIDRYIGESAIANFMNDALVKRSKDFLNGKADFAIYNATGLRGLPLDSDITYGDIYSIMPYADTISIVEVSGQDLFDIASNNAKRMYKKTDLKPFGGSLNPEDFLERGQIHFSSGIRYEIKLGETPEKNIVENMTLNGEKIANVLDKKYKLLVSSYLSMGRGAWNGEKIGQGLPETILGYNLKKLCETNKLDTGLVYRNELISYIKDTKEISPKNGAIKDGRLIIK